MGSSFLTTINVLLGLYAVLIFIKMVVQFGLPGHPARFTMYLVTLCGAAFFSMKALVALGPLPPLYYMQWKSLPLVTGGLGLLLQVITTMGQLTVIQQKVFSRIPLLGAVIVYSLFSSHANHFFVFCLIAASLFLIFSVGKARYQKRMFFKMVLFLSLFGALALIYEYWAYVLGELFLFPALFYFSIFQKTFGISAMVDDFQAESSGEVA